MSHRKFCQHKYIAGKKKGSMCDRFLRKGSEPFCYQHKKHIPGPPEEPLETAAPVKSEPIDIPKPEGVKVIQLKINKDSDSSDFDCTETEESSSVEISD